LNEEREKLARLEAELKAGGGEKRVQQQHESGKLTARERFDLLFDPGTFQELDLFVQHRCNNFGMDKTSIPADGVVTGFGKVNGRTVCAFAQDFTARGGTLGEMHAKKICKVMDMALSIKAPIVGNLVSYQI
jgi:acetyl-CoA carboxylase carboxyltransferase component